MDVVTGTYTEHDFNLKTAREHTILRKGNGYRRRWTYEQSQCVADLSEAYVC